jgi:hypothetical protein
MAKVTPNTRIPSLNASNVAQSLSGSSVIVLDHEEDDMDEDEPETEAVESVSLEDAGLSQLESTVVMAWIQAQGGSDAAGGGAELALELEMDDLAERHPEEEEEVEEEEEDMEGVEQADMNTNTTDSLQLEG